MKYLKIKPPVFFTLMLLLTACMPALEVNDFDSSSARRLDPLVSNYELKKNQLLVFTGRYTLDGNVHTEISSSDSTVAELILTDRVPPVNDENEGLTNFYFETKKRGSCVITAKEFDKTNQTAEYIFHVRVQ
ncbi:MAG: hypothetical protein IPM74_04670 [Crocinitomicaceae bacterium]|nr:hypothetical protein [Crocinitomicaceae bacterium]MBK8925198.1 hypothetical protein [Crocinitomicaceae bacterium]